MFSLHSFSAAAFADAGVEEFELSATGVDTGAPSLATAAISQDHIVTASDVATGAASVANATMSEDETFSTSNVATGAPTLARISPLW